MIFNKSVEFTGGALKELLISYAIQQQPTTVLSPRRNGIKERIHLTIADMLRWIMLTIKYDSEGAWQTELEAALQAIAWRLFPQYVVGLDTLQQIWHSAETWFSTKRSR